MSSFLPLNMSRTSTRALTRIIQSYQSQRNLTNNMLSIQQHVPSSWQGEKVPALHGHPRSLTPMKPQSQNNDESNLAVDCRLSSPLPQGTWDSHTHVIYPDSVAFPMLPSAQYKPLPHTIADARTFYRSTSGLGITSPRMVLTQVSVYGTDNSAMLDALTQLGPEHGRALVEMDPAPGVVSLEELQRWHDLGVRGVRVNLVSVSRELDEAELRKELQAYASVIKTMKTWALELYVPFRYMDMLVNIVPDLGVKVVVDHFGALMFDQISGYEVGKPLADPYEAYPGFGSLVKLLKGGWTWCKISGFYRVTKDIPQMRDLDPIGRELLQQAPDRVVWASDWPHTRFETVNMVPFIEMCYRWCDAVDGGTGEVRQKLFKTNAEEVWDVK